MGKKSAPAVGRGSPGPDQKRRCSPQKGTRGRDRRCGPGRGCLYLTAGQRPGFLSFKVRWKRAARGRPKWKNWPKIYVRVIEV